jgi:hypothetical protein
MTTVVGGVYAERCLEPFWDDVYGSAGRAAAAMSAAVPDVKLVTYRSADLKDGADNLAAVYGLSISGSQAPQAITFDYMHSLADPRITPRPDAIARQDDLAVADEVVLRFGMLEGTARVKARRAVYDPQSAFNPRPFHENGSSADAVALILNRLEGRRLTGETEPERIIDALIGSQAAAVVVLKLGGHGALVAAKSSRSTIPAYRSNTVWKIGSGDVFSAAFTLFWAVEGRQPEEAGDLASRAVAQYSGTRTLPIPGASELLSLDAKPVIPGKGRIYIAAPFFNLAELWMVEEVRQRLLDMGVAVFSPLHDVGRGSASEVARKDLEGLDACDAMLAVLNGADAGTIFEIGYAVARSKPVVALAQNVRPEDLKMPEGTGCRIAEDLVTAIYQAVWSLP